MQLQPCSHIWAHTGVGTVALCSLLSPGTEYCPAVASSTCAQVRVHAPLKSPFVDVCVQLLHPPWVVYLPGYLAAGVYSMDMRQLYDLKDPQWKNDIMPEVGVSVCG
jgi:hypothetical protein